MHACMYVCMHVCMYISVYPAHLNVNLFYYYN